MGVSSLVLITDGGSVVSLTEVTVKNCKIDFMVSRATITNLGENYEHHL